MGATLHRGARASHHRGLSCCGAQAPDAQAQYLWLTGLVALWHVGSSQTRAQTRVPCIGRQNLNHCATREAPNTVLLLLILHRYETVFSLRKITKHFFHGNIGKLSHPGRQEESSALAWVGKTIRELQVQETDPPKSDHKH